MASILSSSERRDLRMAIDDENALVSRKVYNLVLGGTVLFGLALNAVISYFFGAQIATCNPWIVILGSFAVAIASIFVIYKFDKPAISFAGFTLLSVAIGVMLADVFILYDLGTIFEAFTVTCAVVALMILVSGIFTDFFLGLGRVLFLALIAAIVGEVGCYFITGSAPSIFDWIVVLIFCGYVGYDWQRAQLFPPTLDNAIDSAADIYLDIVNLLIRILEIIGDSKK